MAAGIIQGTVTTTNGETIEMSWLVDDTASPTKWWNVSHLVNSAGVSAAFGEGVKGVTVLRTSLATDDVAVTKLTNLVTALGATALDLGPGTGGTRTLRVAVDSSQTDGSEYETVAASQTDQVIGATGAAGDYLSHVVVSPGTAGCGVVTIKDNATTIIAFPGGGTTALSNLIPFIIPVGITSTSGAWKITTGANVTCVAVGNFT
jgi:hypothetical protein